MDGMFNMAKLSSANYDALLVGWATRGVNEGLQVGVNFDAGYSRYSKALSARDYLTSTRGWKIIDSGFENGLLVLDSNGVTIKWTGTTAPSPRFVQANPRGTGNEWFAIVDNSAKIYINNYARGYIPTTINIDNEISYITYFKPPGQSVIVPYNNIVTTLMTNMCAIFAGATAFNQPIDSWDVSNVTDMSQMFGVATPFNQPIGSWNVSKVTNMSYMFDRAISFNQPIGSWNVSNVTNMSYMFTGAIAFNQPIGSWNMINVTDMSNMFRVANAFNQPIGSWDVSKVTNMSYMFHRATSFNQPIGSWDVSKVTDMSYMFSVAEAFNQPIDSWNVSNVTRMSFMFYYQFLIGNTIINGNCVFDQPLGSWNLSKVTNMSYFLRGGSLSTANYDATLIGWAKTYNNQTSYVDFSAGGSQYCNGITARKLLISKGLAITDGGLNCASLGTDAFNKSNVSLYPNPTLGLLKIKIDANIANKPYTIADALGKVVLKGKLNEGDTTINVEHLSKGIYYLKVSDKNASKFIKE